MKSGWLSPGTWQHLSTLCHCCFFFLFLFHLWADWLYGQSWEAMWEPVPSYKEESFPVCWWDFEKFCASLLLSLGLSQSKANPVFFFSQMRSILIRVKTAAAIIFLSSVKDFPQQHCLRVNAPLAADWLPAAFNGTGNLNEGSCVKGIDDVHAWETGEEGNQINE